MNKYPDNFVQNVTGAFGEKGRSWLASLPILIKKYAKKWELSDLKPYTNLSYNYVLSAKHQSSNVVLKLSFCDEFQREVKALQSYNGLGAVKVLKSDLKQGTALLEALIPGHSLKGFFPHKDEEALEITCDVMKKLQSASIKNHDDFPSIKEWHRSLYQPQPNIPEDLLNKARTLSDELIKSQSEIALLHADLHFDNILLDGDNWRAIDPKGVIGEAAYEAGAFIRNPIPEIIEQSNVVEITAQRFNQFSRILSFDRKRLVDWSFVQAILSACWAAEENSENISIWLKIADIIAKSY